MFTIKSIYLDLERTPRNPFLPNSRSSTSFWYTLNVRMQPFPLKNEVLPPGLYLGMSNIGDTAVEEWLQCLRVMISLIFQG